MGNRKIKFRAWDKGKREMREVRDSHWDANGGLEVEYSCQPMDEACHGSDTLMQYTGMKDKNEKEIYEGDILQAPINAMVEGTQTLKVDWALGFWKGHMVYKESEIIGNIYENPELL